MGERIDRNFKVTSLRESDDEFTIDRVNITESLAGAFKSGAKLGDVVPALFDPGKQLFRPIQPYRGVEAFEELRLATERHEPVPTVFLLPMGNRKLRKARSTFAANLLGCAGYEIMDHIGFDTVDGAIAEVKEVMPDIVVICSSDKEYKELVEPICTRLRELDPKPLIVLAGYPEEELTRYQKAGVNMFIHTKANALETLREFHQKLNIIKN